MQQKFSNLNFFSISIDEISLVSLLYKNRDTLISLFSPIDKFYIKEPKAAIEKFPILAWQMLS
jgi:hypothetical protein